MAQIDLAKVRIAGSAEELAEVNVDPSRVYSCGPERPGVRGCPMFNRESGACELPQRHQTGFVKWMKDGQQIVPDRPSCDNLEGAERQGPGPLNVCARKMRIRQDGTVSKVINVTMRCWEYPYQRKQWLMSNEPGERPTATISIIAIEGQKAAFPGSIPQVQPDGKIIHRIQPRGIESIIRPLERPSESPAFAANVMATAEIERDEERERKRNLKDFMHLKQETPSAPAPRADAGTGRGGASSRG